MLDKQIPKPRTAADLGFSPAQASSETPPRPHRLKGQNEYQGITRVSNLTIPCLDVAPEILLSVAHQGAGQDQSDQKGSG